MLLLFFYKHRKEASFIFFSLCYLPNSSFFAFVLCYVLYFFTMFLCLEFVANLTKELLAGLFVVLSFDAKRAAAVDDRHDASAKLSLRDNDLAGVGCGAVDAADLGDGLHGVQAVDGEALGEEDEEGVAGANSKGVLLGELDGLGVVALCADKTGPGRLAEGNAELEVTCHGEDFVEVLHGLDEVRLPKDEVVLLGVLDINDLGLHCLFVCLLDDVVCFIFEFCFFLFSFIVGKKITQQNFLIN